MTWEAIGDLGSSNLGHDLLRLNWLKLDIGEGVADSEGVVDELELRRRAAFGG